MDACGSKGKLKNARPKAAGNGLEMPSGSGAVFVWAAPRWIQQEQVVGVISKYVLFWCNGGLCNVAEKATLPGEMRRCIPSTMRKRLALGCKRFVDGVFALAKAVLYLADPPDTCKL
jgi:hypothetical protein